MAAIDTLAGITEISFRYYEVTAVVDIAAGIDDVSDSTFLITNGGLMRFTDGCTTTFTRCTFIETETSQALGADNFNDVTDNFASNAGRPRFYNTVEGACTPIFKACQWQLANGTRSDFDVGNQPNAAPSFIKDEYGNYCKVTIPYNPNVTNFSQYNHFASELITIDGLVVDHQRQAAGAFEFAKIPDDVDQMKDIIIKNNDPGNASRHVVLLGYNVPDGGSKTIKGLGARNIALFGGGPDYTLKLVDPVGFVGKAGDTSSSYEGRLQGFRTYGGNFLDANTVLPMEARALYFSAIDTEDKKLDVTADNFAIELLTYEQTYESLTTDTSFNDYYEVLCAYGFLSQKTRFSISTTETDPLANIRTALLLFSDTSINVTDVNTVSAYTAVNNSSEIYDGFQYNSVTRQDENSIVGDMIVSAEGVELDFGAYDVVIDPTLDLPYPCWYTPTGATIPAGVTGTYIKSLDINTGQAPTDELVLDFDDLNARTTYTGEDWRQGNAIFGDNGTKLYVHYFRVATDNANTIAQWNLSTPYDISTATFHGQMERGMNGQSGTISFKPDGTRLFISKRWGNWYQVDLDTPWDITTWNNSTWVIKAFGGSGAGFLGHTWSADGTQLFAITDSRSNYRLEVRRWNTIPDPWDISTITTWQVTNFNLGTDGWSTSAQDDRWMNTVNFNSDGSKVYIFNGASNLFWTYDLPAPYDLTGLTLVGTDALLIGQLGDESYAPSISQDGEIVIFTEPRDVGYDSDRRLRVRSYPVDVVKSFAGTPGTAYIKSTNIAVDTFDAIRTTGSITLSNGAGTSMRLIDQSGVVTSVTINGINPNTEVRLYLTADDTEVAGVENSTGTSAALNYTFTTPTSMYIVVHNEQYTTSPRYIEFTSQSTPAVLTVFQSLDRAFNNP